MPARYTQHFRPRRRRRHDELMLMKLARWITKAATLMNFASPVLTEARRHLRLQTDLGAVLSTSLGTIRVRCLDLSRGGATVQTAEPAEVGALVFVRITSVGLMGFAFVRHCRTDGGNYRLGLQFRDGLSRERTTDAGWECQRVTPQLAWDGPEA
jgi:PilZ domain-containing protein